MRGKVGEPHVEWFMFKILASFMFGRFTQAVDIKILLYNIFG